MKYQVKALEYFLNHTFPQGTLIWKLSDAKIFTKEQFAQLPENIKKDVYPAGDHFVQATGKGESWNHSCDANTWWTADDSLSARRDIQSGEEITYDYAISDADPSVEYPWECRCGSDKCRRKLHWNDILAPKLYEEYQSHLPKWVEEFVKQNQKKG